MKTLLANGCSYTYGSGLKESELEEKTWPNQVKEILGYDRTINLSGGCGSNQRIFRTTTQWIMSQPKSVLENTLAIIQFTDLHRYEYYVPKQTKVWENEEERWIRNKIDVAAGPADVSDPILRKEYNEVRLATYSDIEGYWNWLCYCEALSSIFNRHGIKYYFWQIAGRSLDPDQVFYEFLLENYNWINNDINFSCIFERISHKDNHASVRGHRQLAEYLVKYIKV